jgi:hypothetical protein
MSKIKGTPGGRLLNLAGSKVKNLKAGLVEGAERHRRPSDWWTASTTLRRRENSTGT